MKTERLIEEDIRRGEIEKKRIRLDTPAVPSCCVGHFDIPPNIPDFRNRKCKTHYQRTDVILRGWCGMALDGKDIDWSINEEDVTCERCLVAIQKYKTQDNLPAMSAGWDYNR